MSATELLTELRSAGIRVERRPSGNLYLAPKSRLTPELVEHIRRHKAALLDALTCDATLGLLPTSSIDLEVIADAIAAEPRSLFLNDLALSRAARVAVEAGRIIRALPESARREAHKLCASVSQEAADAIRDADYERAYLVLGTFCDKLKAMRPQ